LTREEARLALNSSIFRCQALKRYGDISLSGFSQAVMFQEFQDYSSRA